MEDASEELVGRPGLCLVQEGGPLAIQEAVGLRSSDEDLDHLVCDEEISKREALEVVPPQACFTQESDTPDERDVQQRSVVAAREEAVQLLDMQLGEGVSRPATWLTASTGASPTVSSDTQAAGSLKPASRAT